MSITLPGDIAVWLYRQGVPAATLVRLTPISICWGDVISAGRFEPKHNGPAHIAFQEPEDVIFWRPGHDGLLTLEGRSFALNEQAITAAATYAFDSNLNIFETPLDWLRADCDGIVVLDWSQAFERLRDVPRIALAEPLIPTYRKWMQPCRMPALSVIPSKERKAA